MTAPSRPLFQTVTSSAFRGAVGVAVVFTLVTGAILAAIFFQTNAILTERVLAALRAEAALLSDEARATGLEDFTRSVGRRSQPNNLSLYLLTDQGGRRLAGNLPGVPPELAENPAGAVFRLPDPAAPDVDRMAVAIPVEVPGGRLIVGRDIEDQRAFAEHLRRVVLLSFCALLGAALLAGFIMSRMTLGRIEAINRASRSIMDGEFSRRVPIAGSGDEIDDLAGNLNAMLDRIELLMNGLREVSDNIAHDLKTPLTRLRNCVDQALREPGTLAGYRSGLEQALDEADRLIKTFNALLLIARLEARAFEESTDRLELGALVRDVVELYEPFAEQAGLAVDVTATDGPVIRANRQLVGQAVANLIDNAIKYTAAENRGASSRISVTVDQPTAGAEIRISVGDRGPGIASPDRERALKRFVRLEQSRTKPGTGLGLSLVAAVARLHGGRVELLDNAPGLKAVIVLPGRLDTA